MNHWKPDGEFFVGDCMPFYENGTFHLYYLLDQGHHNHPIVGTLGGHQWAHASTRDLIHWTHHPLALPLDFEAGEGSNCTGSLLDYNGKIYAFYALRSKRFPGEEFRIAVSDDRGVSFRKWDAPELKTNPNGEHAFRDPMAFVGKDGLIHIFITSRSGPQRKGGHELNIGELAHFTTSDLIHYQRQKPVLQVWDPPECCDYFKWGDYYYLIFSNDGEAYYRYSRTPEGPWTAPSPSLTARQCKVMKTAEWLGGRRIGVGWTQTWTGKGYSFAGRTAFREMIQHPDGTLGTAFVPEMLPKTPLSAHDPIRLRSGCGLDWNAWSGLPRNFRLDGTVHFSPETLQFGFHITGADGTVHRHVDFTPHAGCVEFDRTNRIEQVDFSRNELKFKLIRHDGLTDLEIDGMVIDSCKEFLPTISCGLSDPRVEIKVEDAIEFIKDKKSGLYNMEDILK